MASSSRRVFIGQLAFATEGRQSWTRPNGTQSATSNCASASIDPVTHRPHRQHLIRPRFVRPGLGAKAGRSRRPQSAERRAPEPTFFAHGAWGRGGRGRGPGAGARLASPPPAPWPTTAPGGAGAGRGGARGGSRLCTAALSGPWAYYQVPNAPGTLGSRCGCGASPNPLSLSLSLSAISELCVLGCCGLFRWALCSAARQFNHGNEVCSAHVLCDVYCVSPPPPHPTCTRPE
jgi:hypothetical protein